ncbi:MAG: 50S ribosomal protein L1 [Victivallales bacterium]|nr:50S ribosomal protein L1 [Victivallales bacterium]
MFRSKLYKSQRECYDRQHRYSVLEALEIIKKMPQVKFEQPVDVALKLGIDPRKSDQNVRGACPLPKGTGKKITVAVVASGPQAEEAKTAGAEFTGFDDLIEKIKGGWTDFDVLIATPEAMKQVRPLGRVLGPRGLMPNPKTGTVTDAVGEAVREAKFGRVEYRADRGACVHVPIGKLSFPVADLKENFDAIVTALAKAKPATAKGTYFMSCTLSASMSPGVKISSKEFERR